MSLSILSPMSGDTVSAPVSVSTAYDFGTNSFTITTTLTGAAAITSGSLTGSGFISTSMATTASGAVTAGAAADPSSGGSATVDFTIASQPPIIIETVTPLPPPPPPPIGLQAAAAAPAGNKKYKVSGSIKGTTITSVKYRVWEANLRTSPPTWTVVVPYTAATITGNKWKADSVPTTPAAGCFFTVQATGYDASGNAVGQFSMVMGP